jgi:hypothetical protein
MIRALWLIALLPLLPVPSGAACFTPYFSGREPSPPYGFFASKPSIPFCLSSYSYTKTHTCSQWELDSYFEDVADYAEDVRRYNDEVVAFANEAAAYAKEAIEFSDQVYNYAVCEIKEVNSQHE